MKQQVLIADYKYCTGCHACEVACRNEHSLPLDQWGIKITEYGPTKLDGKWLWNFVPIPSTLCDMCQERQDQGMDPTCVHHCLAKCLYAVDIEDVPEKLAELGETVACYL